uniref:CST complex subunit STN1 n=2 Tax=Coturnix japonica TaxID=93934 RepID=A0A8C2UF94_COTJA
MQSESKKYEEETPSLLWGLDPVFSAFARLYIKDIKEMRESKQVPGVFFYNGHPVRQVDVVGMVVQTKEREAFHSYGDSPGTPSSLKVLEQMKKFQEMVSQKTKLQIGDVIRVRGHVRTFRQQREIQSSCFYKVDDPVCDVQISRMLELPCLYREVYDKPFQSPGAGQSGPESLDFLVQTLHEKVRDFLLENKIQTFYQQELETIHSLVSLADGPKSSSSCQVNSGSESSSKRIHSVFKEAIKKLQEKGVVFQKPGTSKDLYYHVTDHDKELLKVTLDVIKEDCRKPRHAEKGCHFLHVLSCVQQTYNPNLAEVVMQRVLEVLESNSDIVSTMEGYYMAF